MKKVSIVVPVYKSEAFLPKLIDSVLGQSYTNFELILVDDESPDNSGKICDDYAQKDKRILVIHKKNGGCCDARNKGLEVATGEYLMLADGDDWLETDCVEYLVDLMEKNDCEMATTDSVFTTRNRIQNDTDNIRICSKEQAMADILYVNIPLGPWNKIYTTSVIRKHHLCFDIPWFGEGLYFSVMAAQFSNKVAIGHRKIYNYRLNNPNSGLTKHEVQHGINALWNIKNIERKLEVRTPMTIHAVNWHHCFYCNFLMLFIILFFLFCLFLKLFLLCLFLLLFVIIGLIVFFCCNILYVQDCLVIICSCIRIRRRNFEKLLFHRLFMLAYLLGEKHM